MIYADNAATTALDPDAFEAMKPFLLEQYGNASQPYSFARPVKRHWQLHERKLQTALVHNLRKSFSLPVELKVTTGQSKEHYNMAIIAQL